MPPAKSAKNEDLGATIVSGKAVSRHLRGSIIGAFILLFWDMALSGSYVMSILVCPIWFLVSILKNAIQRPGWRVAIIRIAIPPLTLGLVLVNSSFQLTIAEANAPRIIAACEKFHSDNGRYPKTLDELVPRYLSYIPRAKYCFDYGEFRYWNHEEEPMLEWCVVPPFGRKIYTFNDRRWGYID